MNSHAAHSRATFFAQCAAFSLAPAIARGSPVAEATADHEHFMRLAIAEAKRNPTWPFGAVIVGTASGEVLSRGVNSSAQNPMFHGEVVAMNDYIARHGNRGWPDVTLYTTAEPCSMCASAIVWAGIPRVVYASSTPFITTCMDQISIRMKDVPAGAPFYQSRLLLGGVLASETDPLFANRPR